MRRRLSGRVLVPLLAGAFTVSLLLLGCQILGCQSETPGITNKPPPKGGPPANNRRPPGEVNAGPTR
jgi:hypothetical protein